MGSSTVSKPSRFLEDIPQQLIHSPGWWQDEDSQISQAVYSWNKAPASNPVTLELKAGDHVYHNQFGEGVVVNCKEIKNDSEVVVAFVGIGVKKLLLSLANLEKI